MNRPSFSRIFPRTATDQAREIANEAMQMTDHPCKGMTRAAINAFEAIAVNQRPHCSKATLQKLVDRGLIVKETKTMHFGDGLSAAKIDDFYVPLPIHYQWCEWGSERYRGKI